MELKARIETLLSEILSDMYDCEVKLHFEKKEEAHEHNQDHH